LESLATLSPGIIVFVAAMAGGMALHDFRATEDSKPGSFGQCRRMTVRE
jgi:hypothetical protein